MKRFANSTCKFLVSEEGPTAVEYAVMLALIIAVCAVTVSRLGRTIAEGPFEDARDAAAGLP